MKTFLAICCVFLVGSMSAMAVTRTLSSFLSEMTVNADVQDAFYQKYPDLTDERETVDVAVRSLVAGGGQLADGQSAEEALAVQTRKIMALRTPLQWRQKATSLYPALGVEGSEFNTLFLQRYKELSQTSPQFVQEPSWPVLLAKRCADELEARAQAAAAAPAADDATANPARPSAARPSSSSPQAATQSKHPHAPASGDATGTAAPAKPSFWKTAVLAIFSVVLLAGIAWLPAGWMFRLSHAFGRHEETVTAWQRALRPAAWAYLAVAFFALFQTFHANADQSFGNRFGITLLVSVVSGCIAAMPVFAVAWGISFGLRRTPPHEDPHEGDRNHARAAK